MKFPCSTSIFWRFIANKMGKLNLKISYANMESVLTYEWPGNLRELENLIEGGTILSSDERFLIPKLNEDTIVSDSG